MKQAKIGRILASMNLILGLIIAYKVDPIYWGLGFTGFALIRLGYWQKKIDKINRYKQKENV